MSPVHVHLMLNHVPIVGLILGVLLFALAFFRKSQELMRVCLVLFVALGLVSIPVFLTGEPSEELVEHLPGVSESMIEEHEESAEVSLIAIEILAVAALAGLILFRKVSIPSWFIVAALILSLAAAGLMSWTGNLGGQIRHSEVRAGGPADPPSDDDSPSDDD